MRKRSDVAYARAREMIELSQARLLAAKRDLTL